nr:MAG TPA: hypothetical protein [Caudoviricetes sp.]
MKMTLRSSSKPLYRSMTSTLRDVTLRSFL